MMDNINTHELSFLSFLNIDYHKIMRFSISYHSVVINLLHASKSSLNFFKNIYICPCHRFPL
jgi:hypothetical protein